MAFSKEIDLSLGYLKSDAALRALKEDPYWPKWDSPWWHMLLLHEMGMAREIPQDLVSAYVESINRLPCKSFPPRSEDVPPGMEMFRASPCHCQLGTVYQVLSACGVDVDREVPWIRPWLLGAQMSDGGLNCDDEAYGVQDEVASSMVGTIGAFEAILLCTPRAWTDEERAFVKKGAEFLIARKLMLGSTSRHNADEREDEADWLKPCFPRFYFYDVLRGLSALLLWREKTGGVIPVDAVEGVVQALSKKFPDGQIRIERHSYEDTGTILQDAAGVWQRRQPATFFPLLRSVSEIGKVSPFLSRQWDAARERLRAQTQPLLLF